MNLRKKHSHNLLLLLLSLILCLGIAEIGLRFLTQDRLVIYEDERNLAYQYDEELGWFPVENSQKQYTGSRTIDVEHNSRGFRDPEHVIDNKPRILFLGDSFVWGFDVEQQERFTEKLREKLPDWSLYNLGVSGYGTDQEYLLLKRHYDFYNPTIVFLVFGTETDLYDNSHNVVYNGYYKPYFVVNGNTMTLQGIPVPKSEHYFFVNHKILSHSYLFRLFAKVYFKIALPPEVALDNPTPAIISSMNEYVKSKGAKFIVGATSQNLVLEKFLKDNNIPYVDLSNSYRYPSHGYHWTPEGHAFVSEKIYQFLMEGKYLQSK